MTPTNDILFSSDLWKPALEKYASATHVTIKLFAPDLRIVLGPLHPTPLFELFDRGGYDPGLFVECARQCLVQKTDRPAITVSKMHGLAVIGTSLVLDGKIVGAAVAGYVLVDFSQLSEIQRVAKDARLDFSKLWHLTREQSPVAQQRITVNGELLQALGDALLRENSRTRQYEQTALELQATASAKESAHQKLLQAASVLRESEERYRTLFDLGPIAVYSCDSSGVIRDYNHVAADLWGREPKPGDTDERWCGSFKMLRPDGTVMPHAQCPMAQVISGEVSEVHDGEVQIERPDGSRITVLVNIRPLKNEQGEITGAINCFVDISERKEAEESLRESEQRFREMIDALPTAIYTTDSKGHLTHFNPPCLELSGRAPTLGTDQWCVSWKLYWPDGTSLPHDECPMAIALREDRAMRGVEIIAERPDSKRIWLAAYPTPLHNAEGKITGGINMLVDITERKKAEDAIRESEERFRMLANTIPQLAWMANPTGFIFWYNQGWYDFTGTTPKEMEGWGWQSVHDPDVLPQVLERWRESISTGKPFEMVFPLRGADGAFRSFLTRVMPMLDADGKIFRWFGTNTDITEQQRAQQVLREAKGTLEIRVKERTAELEARNTEILDQSDQLQDLSLRLMRTQDEERRRISRELHDSLGQYLASAKMSIESLRRSDPTAKESRNIQQAVDTLEKCLTETRTISHLLHPPLLDEVGFSSAAKWYIEGFSERSGIQSNVAIVDAPQRLSPALELALFRILQESLVNVHRHSHSQSVDIKLQSTPSHEVTLEVRDHGHGMPSEMLERFRAKDGLGGGVGLRSMSGRIRELGGSFEIQSDENGTLIRVTAPVPESSTKSELAFEKASSE